MKIGSPAYFESTLQKIYRANLGKNPGYKIPVEPKFNYENYYVYKNLVTTGRVFINVNDITRNTWKQHYDAIYAILCDGIEQKIVQSAVVTVHFDKYNMNINLSIPDYYMNLMMWYILVFSDTPIQPGHLVFEKEFTKNTIKKYIDRYLIDPKRKVYTNIELCNIIDGLQTLFKDINNFSMYLSNTMNNEDTVFMMQKDEEFDDLMHTYRYLESNNLAIDEYKQETTKRTNRIIEKFKKDSKAVLGFDHCHTDAFRAGEGVNKKQFTEYQVAIGYKPNSEGNIQPKPINRSFINGGLEDPIDYFIESSAGRVAQILTKMNVGESGNFARLLNLNNGDAHLHPDPNYVCDSKNYLKLTITDEAFLNKYTNRYYKLDPDRGVEYLLTPDNGKELIGKTLYFRSPCTCASAARGEGICYRCYGDQAYTNNTINIGRIASEILSSVLTQILLSAKHLLETAVESLNWCDEFKNFFEVDGNTITISEELELKEWRMLIDPDNIGIDEDDIAMEDEDDDSPVSFNQYNEYVTEFEMQDSNGNTYPITNEKAEKLYISPDLNSIIRKKAEPVDGKISINAEELKEITLFLMNVQNNGLTKTLNQLNRLLNNNTILKNYDLHSWAQAIIDTVIKGGLSINGIHLEVLMHDQIRAVDNILERPQWEYPNEPYELVSLNKALTNNPSVTISISYQKVSKLLYNPLTFRKNKPSFMDLFFMERPQKYIRDLDESEVYDLNDDGLINPLIAVEDNSKITGVNSNNFMDSLSSNDDDDNDEYSRTTKRTSESESEDEDEEE